MADAVLITGGAGFIGSRLARELLAGGQQVLVLDDFSTGRRENVDDLLSNSRFELVTGTVEDAHTVDLLVSRVKHVYHLASAVGVQLIVDQPVRTIRTIIHGTEVVLNSAQRFGKPVLITSSSEVYGKSAKVPFSEDDDIVMGSTRHSRWCYAYAKGIDEFLGLAYFKQFGLPVRIVRLFNTVGPGQVGQYGMVLPRFAEAAKANKPLRVFGSGDQTRTFCHVSDVVRAIVTLMDKPDTAGQVFNVGGEEEVSINELAQRVIAAAGSKSTIEHIPYEQAYGQPFDDLVRRVPNLQRIRAAIGYAPTYSLGQIIEEVVKA